MANLENFNSIAGLLKFEDQERRERELNPPKKKKKKKDEESSQRKSWRSSLNFRPRNMTGYTKAKVVSKKNFRKVKKVIDDASDKSSTVDALFTGADGVNTLEQQDDAIIELGDKTFRTVNQESLLPSENPVNVQGVSFGKRETRSVKVNSPRKVESVQKVKSPRKVESPRKRSAKKKRTVGAARGRYQHPVTRLRNRLRKASSSVEEKTSTLPPDILKVTEPEPTVVEPQPVLEVSKNVDSKRKVNIEAQQRINDFANFCTVKSKKKTTTIEELTADLVPPPPEEQPLPPVESLAITNDIPPSPRQSPEQPEESPGPDLNEEPMDQGTPQGSWVVLRKSAEELEAEKKMVEESMRIEEAKKQSTARLIKLKAQSEILRQESIRISASEPVESMDISVPGQESEMVSSEVAEVVSPSPQLILPSKRREEVVVPEVEIEEIESDTTSVSVPASSPGESNQESVLESREVLRLDDSDYSESPGLAVRSVIDLTNSPPKRRTRTVRTPSRSKTQSPRTPRRRRVRQVTLPRNYHTTPVYSRKKRKLPITFESDATSYSSIPPTPHATRRLQSPAFYPLESPAFLPLLHGSFRRVRRRPAFTLSQIKEMVHAQGGLNPYDANAMLDSRNVKNCILNKPKRAMLSMYKRDLAIDLS